MTTKLEHPAVGDSIYTLAKVYGKKRRIAGVDPATGRVPPESIRRLVDRGTDALAFVHGSNVTGAIIDVEALVSEARRLNPDIFIIVDGVQYASHHWVAAAMAASGNHTAHLLDLLVNGSHGVPGLKAIEGVRLHAMEDGTQDCLGIALFEVDGIGAAAATEEYLRQGIAL